MKKRFMAALSVLALALAMPVAAFAANSPANVKSGPVTSNGVTANASGVAAGSDAWLKVVGTGTAATNVPSGSNVVASFEVTQHNTSGPYNFTFALGSQYAGAKVTAYIQHDSGVREEKELTADANGNVSFTMNELCIISLVAQPTSGASAAGWGFVNHSVSQGKKKIEEKTQKVIKAKGDTITYNGKKYELNKHMATVAFIGFDGRDNDDGTQKGQSDTVMVVALNTDTGEARGIVIPRDSMVAVDTYSNGSFAGQVTEQLCLQFAYGTDGDNSSQLTAAAASRVLDNIPVAVSYTHLTLPTIRLV